MPSEYEMARERLNLLPAKLLTLADWIDAKYPDDADPEVQRDLREAAENLILLLDHDAEAVRLLRDALKDHDKQMSECDWSEAARVFLEGQEG